MRDQLIMALEDLRPDGGLNPAAPAAGTDDLDLSGLEADGRDWVGFSVDQSFSEDATLISSTANDDFGREVIMPATGQVLTRRELLADLLRAMAANLKANRAMLGRDRLRQQDQVRKLIGAMMNSVAASDDAETLAEDTARLLLGAMSAAGQSLCREPKTGPGGDPGRASGGRPFPLA